MQYDSGHPPSDKWVLAISKVNSTLTRRIRVVILILPPPSTTHGPRSIGLLWQSGPYRNPVLGWPRLFNATMMSADALSCMCRVMITYFVSKVFISNVTVIVMMTVSKTRITRMIRITTRMTSEL